MKAGVEPLVNDGFAGEATKRALGYLQKQREQGKNIVGIYCGYAPLEVIRAANAARRSAKARRATQAAQAAKSRALFVVQSCRPAGSTIRR